MSFIQIIFSPVVFSFSFFFSLHVWLYKKQSRSKVLTLIATCCFFKCIDPGVNLPSADERRHTWPGIGTAMSSTLFIEMLFTRFSLSAGSITCDNK